MSVNALENLTGTIEEITYFNEENGYTVMVISSEGEPLTVVGSFPQLAEGVEVRLLGEWVNHSTYGNQFKASLVEQTLPSDAAGILRYLASGIIKGVRESTAVKIVEAFGTEAFDVIESASRRREKFSRSLKHSLLQERHCRHLQVLD